MTLAVVAFLASRSPPTRHMSVAWCLALWYVCIFNPDVYISVFAHKLTRASLRALARCRQFVVMSPLTCMLHASRRCPVPFLSRSCPQFSRLSTSALGRLLLLLVPEPTRVDAVHQAAAMQDLYAILDVPKTVRVQELRAPHFVVSHHHTLLSAQATVDQIRKMYYKLSLKWQNDLRSATLNT